MPRPAPPHRARTAVLAAWLAALVLLAGACVPAIATAAPDTPAARAAERAAQETFHRMELGRLATGSYTTNVLVDVDLPRGSRLTLESFTGDTYRLRLDLDELPEIVWIIEPRGVRRVVAR